MPGSLHQAGRHTNFATFSKIQWKRDIHSEPYSLQKDQQKWTQGQSDRPPLGRPAPVSLKPRDLSCGAGLRHVAHLSEFSVQMAYGLIQIKF